MNRTFSNAAIERIARIVQLPNQEPESAAGFVDRILEGNLHERLSVLEADALLGIWYGDDWDPALQFVSFAGFLELGAEAGYLSLREWETAPALQKAISAFLASPSAESGVVDLRLLAVLHHRIEQPDSGPRAADDDAFASFESYLHLTGRLRADGRVQDFLEETHTLGYPDGHVARDLSALLTPRHFAEAFATGAIARVPVTRTADGVALLRYFEWLAEIRERLAPDSELRAGIVRHARWAHGASRIQGRFNRWALHMREWTEEQGEAWIEGWEMARHIFDRLAVEQERWNALKGALSTAPPPQERPEAVSADLDRSIRERIDQLVAEGRDVAARSLALTHAGLYAPRDPDPDDPDFSDRTYDLVLRCLKLAQLGNLDAAAAIVAPVLPILATRSELSSLASDALDLVARARRSPQAEERRSVPAARSAETAVESETEEKRYLST